MKKLLLTLLIALSMVLCGSAITADDGPKGRVLPQDSQAVPGAFQEAWAAEQEELDQSMILAADDKKGKYEKDNEKDDNHPCEILCAHYERKCCETSPVKNEKWCDKEQGRTARCDCSCPPD